MNHPFKPCKDCNSCLKNFFNKSSVTRHHPVHTGEKSHVCDICHKEFGEKSNLKMHYMVHTKQKVHSYSNRNVEFSKKEQVTHQQLTHSGEKSSCDTKCKERGNTKEYSVSFLQNNASATITQSCIDDRETSKDYLSSMKKSVALAEVNLNLKMQAIKGANSSIEIGKTILNTKTKILNDAIRDISKCALPGNDAVYHSMMEKSLSDLKKGVSHAQESLANKMKFLECAEKAVSIAKTVLQKKVKLLDDAQSINED